MHKKLIAQEVMKQREDLKSVTKDRDRFREALIKIKSSFYQTNVFSQLKEASSKKGDGDDKEKESNSSTKMGDDSVVNEVEEGDDIV